MPTTTNQQRVLVVVPNWNGAEELHACLDSVQNQTIKNYLVVVDNGSIDNSVSLIKKYYPEAEIIAHKTNLGYAGGVNPGLQRAIEMEFDYVAPFNNDAIADKDWLKHLVSYLDKNPEVGIATCKILSSDGTHLDSTGEGYSTWGLPYPRGRGETYTTKYDNSVQIFGASGGASLYRVNMLKEVGLLDDDFFAYYEDMDLSFRAQLAGWKVTYVPASEVYHEMSVTGARIKGFFTYQTMKNLPWLFWKNVPTSLIPTILPRFTMAYLLFFLSAARRGQLRYALSGSSHALIFLPKKLMQRRDIQRRKTVSTKYIKSMLTFDLPPNALRLRELRDKLKLK